VEEGFAAAEEDGGDGDGRGKRDRSNYPGALVALSPFPLLSIVDGVVSVGYWTRPVLRFVVPSRFVVQIEADSLNLTGASLEDQAAHVQNASRLGYDVHDLREAFRELNRNNLKLFSKLSSRKGVLQFFKDLGL
jgi:hypothetical protein